MNAATQSDPALVRQQQQGYWRSRRNMLYYKAIGEYVKIIGFDARSVIDVGCGSTPISSWFGWIPEKFALDFKVRPRPVDVSVIETDFLRWTPDRRYDVCLCLQVLEHQAEPEAFCDKLKQLAEHLLITVPYKWTGNAPGHIQDPVDLDKMKGWMKVVPNNSQVVYEPFREGRLICYYNTVKGPSFRFDKNFILEALANRELTIPD